MQQKRLHILDYHLYKIHYRFPAFFFFASSSANFYFSSFDGNFSKIYISLCFFRPEQLRKTFIMNFEDTQKQFRVESIYSIHQSWLNLYQRWHLSIHRMHPTQ